MKLNNLIVLLLILCISCSTTKIDYSTKRVYELERKGMQIQYKAENIKFRNLFLDKSNVSSVIRNKRTNTINILPKNSNSEFITAQKLVDEIKSQTKTEFELIIINGIPIEKSELDILKIEKSVYDKFDILKAEKANQAFPHRQFKNDILLILTK